MVYPRRFGPARLTALVAVAAILVSACAGAPASVATAPSPAASATQTPVQPAEVSVSLPVLNIPDYLPLFAARAKGYFDEEKITPKFILLSGTEATKALVGGSLDLSASSGTAINGIMAGLPLKAIAATNLISPYKVYSNDPSVKSLKDLEGKTVGVDAIGDTRHENMLTASQAQGVDYKKIQFIPLGAGNTLAGLAANRVAAAPLLGIEADKFVASPGVKATLLIDLQAQKVPILSGGLAASDAGIKAKGDVFVRFLRAYLKGVAYTQAYIADSAKLMAAQPELKGLTSAKDLEDAGKDFWIVNPPPTTLSIGTDVQAKMIEVKKITVPNALPNIGPPQIFDYSLVQKAYETLKASGWKPTGP